MCASEATASERSCQILLAEEPAEELRLQPLPEIALLYQPPALLPLSYARTNAQVRVGASLSLQIGSLIRFLVLQLALNLDLSIQWWFRNILT